MDIRKMTKDDLELLSFTDIAYNIIKQDKEIKTTVQLFKEICSLLELNEQQYEEKISDFFTSLTTDKRFILLNSVNWDLKENHSVQIDNINNEEELDDIDEDIDDLDLEEDTNEEQEEEDIENVNDDDLDEDIDGLDELEIVDEDSEFEE